MSMNGELTSGFVARVMKNTSGEWDWSLTRYKNRVAGGHTKTEKEALAALKKAVGDALVDTTLDRNRRSIAKLKLKGWVERRPYIAMHVFGKALDGVGLGEIIKTAAHEEIAIHKAEQERCGEKLVPPLSEHPNRKPAREVADEMCALIRALGWKKPQLKKYTEDMFGPQFFNPGLTVEDMISMAFEDAKKKAAQE